MLPLADLSVPHFVLLMISALEVASLGIVAWSYCRDLFIHGAEGHKGFAQYLLAALWRAFYEFPFKLWFPNV